MSQLSQMFEPPKIPLHITKEWRFAHMGTNALQLQEFVEFASFDSLRAEFLRIELTGYYPESCRFEFKFLEREGGGEISQASLMCRLREGVNHPVREQATGAIRGQGCLGFGEALFLLESGKKVARQGWNGKGMWLKLIPMIDWTLTENHLPDVAGLVGLPWIGMKTADNKFVPWLASQTDVLAKDWMEYE